MTEEMRLTTEVLNCDYFNRNRGFNCYKGKNCTEASDCYYRQLQRLKQENKQMKSALEEILESAKFAQCLPCGSGNLEDCLNCSDETTNNGQFCIEKRIHEIKTKCVEVLK